MEKEHDVLFCWEDHVSHHLNLLGRPSEQDSMPPAANEVAIEFDVADCSCLVQLGSFMVGARR